MLKNRVNTHCDLQAAAPYRFAFNGMEKDDEVHGSTGNSYDFGARIHDPRVGRWWGIDPKAHLYAGESPYSAFLNSPIQYKDPTGTVVRDQHGNIIYSKSGEASTQTIGGKVYSVQPVYVYLNDGTYIDAEIITPMIENSTAGDVSTQAQGHLFVCHGHTMLDGAISTGSEWAESNTLALDKMGKLEASPSEAYKELNTDLSQIANGDIMIWYTDTKVGDGNQQEYPEKNFFSHSAIYTGDGNPGGPYESKNGLVDPVQNYSLQGLASEYGNKFGFFTPQPDRTVDISGSPGMLPGTTEVTHESAMETLTP